VTALAPTGSADVLRPVDPATLEPLPVVPVTPPEALDEVVAGARRAQAAWARRTTSDRARLLRRVSQEMLDAADEIAATIVSETGKPAAEALTSELFVCLDHCAWLARNATRVLRTERLPLRQPYLIPKRAWLRYEPIGVIGVVSPWNFPLGVPFTQIATAVASGNGVVVKPSELTPATGAWLEELFRRADAPEGLVRVVQGTGATLGAALVAHPGVGGVVFTGSTAVGRDVGRRAAERLVPAVLELGGKDPMLVLDDADLDRAVDGALWGAFTNCGQVCSGIERVYVERPLFDPFVERLAERAGGLRLGHGGDPTTDLGPLIAEGQRLRVEALVADAVEHGAQIAHGGGRGDAGLPGWFHQPTVIIGEPPPSRIASEEIFGPVVTVVMMDNEPDGIRRANASRFGLGASVWTRDRSRARRVAAQLEAGSVWVNDHAYSYGVCQAPWGGRKESGHGRTHSKHGLYAMTHVKFTDADAGRFRPPWWYPYSPEMLDGFRGVLGTLYRQGVSARSRALARHRRGAAELLRRTRRG
jgi:succinate-semialdehyde dehydrogenase/glutarate-semialdehyde dehydrogenase